MPRSSFETDAGPPIERRRGTVKMAELDCAMILTTAQAATFEDFVQVDLAGGVLPFTFLHPRKNANATVRLVIDGDKPYRLRPLSGVEWEAAFRLLVVG